MQGGLSLVMEQMKRVYQHFSAEERQAFRGGSWRLPEKVANEQIVGPFLEICRRYLMPVKACKANLIGTP